MTFADKIRAKGFSLADCKFFKLNALFPMQMRADNTSTSSAIQKTTESFNLGCSVMERPKLLVCG